MMYVTSWETQVWDLGVVGDLLQHVVVVGVDAKWLLEMPSSATCSKRVTSYMKKEPKALKHQLSPGEMAQPGKTA